MSSAKGWGMWDMAGGGLFSTYAKHSHIDEARTHAQQAQSPRGQAPPWVFGGPGLCGEGEMGYERFGYSLVATFVRASRDVFLQFHIRNECSDAFSGPWTDQAITVDQASWEFPFSGMPLQYFAGEGEIASLGPSPSGSVLLELAAQGSRAVFLDELLPEEDLSQFEGMLHLSPDGSLSATVLQARPGQLATLPATPAAGGSQELHFAHFADGQGITSQILLFPSDPEQQGIANVQLQLRASDGNPLSVVLNGEMDDGQTNLEIPSLGLAVLQSSGLGDLQTGNLTVISDRALAGVIVFGGSEGRAGVAGSLALPNGFAAPMQTDSALGIRTGVALMNLEDEPLAVSLQLFDRDGASIAMRSQDLPPRGSLPRFLDELFPELDLTGFEGILRATAPGRIAATALETRPGRFATLPVAQR